MALLTTQKFQHWLERYGQASKENDPRASSELFSWDAKYYETPFDEPICGRDAIYKYWERGAKTLKDKTSSYEVLAVKDEFGIARWQSKFTNISTEKRLALDCLFVVEFDDDGKCSLFREWWHLQAIDAGMDGNQ